MTALWIIQLVLIVVSIVLAAVARRIRRPWLGGAGIVPLALGVVTLAFGVPPEAPSDGWAVATGFALAALAVVAGGPAAATVLDVATQKDVPRGAHGGIMILSVRAGGGSDRTEVLRGGAAIGYLERIAIVAAVVTGHLEIVAAVIAIKGLGRFSELDSAEARERFIIGTFASMIWAGAVAALIVLPA